MKVFEDVLYRLILVLALAFLIVTESAVVVGESMLPTLKDSDFVIVSKYNNTYNYGDIVVIKSDLIGEDICKRVIGVADDNVVIDSTGLHINGETIVEDYILSDNWYTTQAQSIDVVVPNASVFVLGDNRQKSYDSRVLGCIDEKSIEGKLVFNVSSVIGLPFQTIRIIVAICGAIALTLILIDMYRKRGRKE